VILREHQKEAVKAIEDRFRYTNKQYIEMPTGSGKTITFLHYAKTFHENVLIIVPSIQLMNQIYEEALKFYDKKIVSRKGGNYNDILRMVHICVIHSVKGEYLRILEQENYDLVIFDEAHHIQSESYRKFLKAYEEENSCDDEPKYLGVTATPDRLDGKFLQELLGKCSFKLDLQELIQKKVLCDVEGFSVKTGMDLSDIDIHNGDFSLKHLYKKLCTDSRNKMIVNLIQENMIDRKTIVFCINIEHSKGIAGLLNEGGIESVHIDGTMNLSQRAAILSAFREGQKRVLCNCQLLTEGFDEPSIDGIILARPTRSKALFTQMIGRGLRLSPGKKNCKIIDVVDAHRSLAGFNTLIEDVAYPDPEKFKSIREIQDHLYKEKLKVTEFRLERADLIKTNSYESAFATEWMMKYIKENKIPFYEPLSIDEGSFLVWHDKLRKEYKTWRQ